LGSSPSSEEPSSSPPEPPVCLRLPIPFPIGHVNAYLLRGEPLTLVDTGPRWAPALAALEKGLARERLHIEDIELLVLSHQHEDHLGLAATVRERSGCEVAAHELLVDVVRDVEAERDVEDAYEEAMLALHGAPIEVIATVAEISPAARRFIESVEVTRPLRDGEVLVAGGRELMAELRPGHSPTDTVFVSPGGWAIVADHLLADRPSVTMAHRPPAGPQDPRERPPALVRYRESLAKTAADELSVAYPGHWERVDDPNAAIRDRLALQDKRAARILQKLARPATAWEVVESIWGRESAVGGEDHPLPKAFIVLCDVLAHIDLLVADGRARSIDDGRVIRYEAA
jgi:glyoxylase-like metal-dependent hydrolase (beta-lactamase superfamily II)